MKRWRWVEYEVVLAIHDRQLAEHGGLDGVRNENAIRSALDRPKNLTTYERPDGATLAASYLSGLTRGHGFADGNKRTAWVVSRLFLLDNGLDFRFDPVEAVKFVESVASGDISEDQVAEWFRERLKKLPRRS